MKIRVFKNGDIRFIENGEEKGFGFITEEKEVALMRCPKCGLENYHSAMLTGQCAWCGFSVKKLGFE